MGSKLQKEGVEKILQYYFDRAEKFRKENVAFSAIVWLASIENYLTYREVHQSIKLSWSSKLANVVFFETELASALEKAQSVADRLQHVMGVGSYFEDDEITLLLTLRIELGLFNEYLRAHFSDLAQVEVSKIDVELLEIYQEQTVDFENEVRNIKRNEDLPKELPDIPAYGIRN